MVQVNTLTPQDMFHNPSTVQGTPSYIIQAPAGQTYIIQQPANSLVRQTHTGELATGSEGLDGSQHDQVMVKLQLQAVIPSLPQFIMCSSDVGKEILFREWMKVKI